MYCTRDAPRNELKKKKSDQLFGVDDFCFLRCSGSEALSGK